jgi:hypothetical protein
MGAAGFELFSTSVINHARCVLNLFCFNNLIDSRLFAPEVKVIHFPYIISFLPFG